MPKKQKLHIEETVEIIRDYRQGTIRVSETAQRGCAAQRARSCEADGAEAFLLHTCTLAAKAFYSVLLTGIRSPETPAFFQKAGENFTFQALTFCGFWLTMGII